MSLEIHIPTSDIQIAAQTPINPREHYLREVGPIEHRELEECPMDIRNIGWTLGNDCPYRCNHCYSMAAREKGMKMTTKIIDRVVDQLAVNGVETVNLGGNEPLFTNGLDPKATLLPYIIRRLNSTGIKIGLTTSGVTLVFLERDHNAEFRMLNDIDISFDSPYEEEHNENRGAPLYRIAVKCLETAQQYDIDHTIIMCAMNWNFTEDRICALVDLAKRTGSNMRINTLKPVTPEHMKTALAPQQYYRGFALLMDLATPIDLGEPPLATVTNFEHARGCPCGRTSFRIHSITPDGRIPVSPCVYLHDYKTGDLTKDDLYDIVRSPQFKTFRRRNAHPEAIPECEECPALDKCRGGCAARSYLYHAHQTGRRSLFVKDPYCPKDVAPTQVFPQTPQLPTDVHLVHMNYLCTWIGRPK